MYSVRTCDSLIHLIHRYPIGSISGMFANIYHKNQPDVGKYTSPMDPVGYRICITPKSYWPPNSWKIGIEKWDKLSTCGTFGMVQRPSYPFRGKKQAANVRMVIFEGLSLPIGSMGLVNVGKCTIHGSYGHGKSPRKKRSNCMVNLWNLP